MRKHTSLAISPILDALIPSVKYRSMIASFLSGLQPADHGPWALVGVEAGVERCRFAGLGVEPVLSLSLDSDLDLDLVGDGDGDDEHPSSASACGVRSDEEGGLGV